MKIIKIIDCVSKEEHQIVFADQQYKDLLDFLELIFFMKFHEKDEEIEEDDEN